MLRIRLSSSCRTWLRSNGCAFLNRLSRIALHAEHVSLQFAEAIAEEPDFFLLVGHMPVHEDNWPAVYNAVRAVHPNTPILIFGGHTHIRDCCEPTTLPTTLDWHFLTYFSAI